MTTTIHNDSKARESSATQPTAIQEVEPAVLAQWLKDGRAIVVDVRETDEFIAERIEGALNRPLSGFNAADMPWRPNKTIVLNCRSGNRSKDAARQLVAAGCDSVCHLAGGIQAWGKAGLPLKRLEKAPISIMRQVQITAGSIVFVGTLLGAFVSPWFLLISGFVGAGLVFAGLSGTCGMASLLSHMPWNKAFRGATTCET